MSVTLKVALQSASNNFIGESRAPCMVACSSYLNKLHNGRLVARFWKELTWRLSNENWIVLFEKKSNCL